MLKVVQGLCRSFYGVTAVTAESYGCVWHFQHAYAGDDELQLPLEWMSDAIVSDQGPDLKNPSTTVDAQSRA